MDGAAPAHQPAWGGAGGGGAGYGQQSSYVTGYDQSGYAGGYGHHQVFCLAV